jgi:cephalosporin hydroxylase
MTPNEFKIEVRKRVEENSKNSNLTKAAQNFMIESTIPKYSYNFDWLGRPIIQYPQDIIAMQEIIYEIKPDLIIETGIAHGGSLIFSASMLALLDLLDAIESETDYNITKSKRKVIGIDIDIREHNRVEIIKNPLAKYIEMIEGSSVSDDTFKKASKIAENYKKVLVLLDSNHTHDHVIQELNMYAPLTSIGSYCCVFDTIVEDLPNNSYQDRPWSKGNNPKTAVWEFLDHNSNFIIDEEIQNKILITVAPDGFLKRIK